MISNPKNDQLSLPDVLPVGSPAKSALKSSISPRRTHGGLASLGKRKTTRPFEAKAPLHLVLRSHRAKGKWSMLHRKNQAKITSMVYVYAKRFKVRVYRVSNLGREIHLLVKASEKKQLSDFLRVFAGRVAVTVTGAQKLVKKVGRFWEHLYWSRLVNWGPDFYGVREFIKTAPGEVVKLAEAGLDEFYWKKIPLG